MRLIDLYRPMLTELTGQRLDIRKMPDDVQVQWDDFAQRNNVGRVEFIERNGKIYAADLKDKGTWYEWGADGWKATGRLDVKRGREPGRYQTRDWRSGSWQPNDDGYGGRMVYPPGSPTASCYDTFSKDPTSYRNNVGKAATKIFGKDWEQTIEKVYGNGAVNRMFNDLWKNFWTDHEALGEVGHFFDAARQALDGDGRSDYNLHIGPRWDVPGGEEAQMDTDYGDPTSPHIRRQRVTSSDYFDNMAWGYG